jgi:hypothetical protein
MACRERSSGVAPPEVLSGWHGTTLARGAAGCVSTAAAWAGGVVVAMIAAAAAPRAHADNQLTTLLRKPTMIDSCKVSMKHCAKLHGNQCAW